ncbi:uncharacterized protein FA14DRAFT_88449 [Meira miltonrushii]|uniref:Zn(2)-C6 fungal-type domain-containing protein n=1 Tax=Meira miltonrushii TaxID=1280837 RepID=A0A316V1W1_9BASI|nr:uncharacterized protein FA14DRAFT_88449 [Meira miltonrushii]PWN31540.1 hypothetical protein FA14DRAFT_88449 [Meira miltonrushii]
MQEASPSSSTSSKRKSTQIDTPHLSAAERKKRKPLSCDPCRQLKRKCDRGKPCKQCGENNKQCSYKQATAHLVQNGQADTSPLSAHASPSSSPLHTSESPHPFQQSLRFPEQLTDKRFVDVLLTFWFQELDYMYDAVNNTALHLNWKANALDLSPRSVFRPLLAVLLALTGQLRPRELDRAFRDARVLAPSSAHLAPRAFDFAIRFTDDYLDTYDPTKDVFVLEYLHASMHVMAYLKNCGRKTHVRNRIARDISCLQLAHIHLLDSNSPRNRSNLFKTPLQRQSARRLFWSYFQYDRFYIMIDNASSYCLQANQCDIWMCDEVGQMMHIQDLCREIDVSSMLDEQPSQPINNPARLKSKPLLATIEEVQTCKVEARLIAPFSSFSSAMLQAAAIGGKTTDAVLHIPLTSLDPNAAASEEVMEALRCFTAAGTLDKQLLQLQNRYEVEFGVAKSFKGPLRASSSQWQNNVLCITLAKLRRDAAVCLGMAIPRIADDPTWLNRRRVETAATLLQYALVLPQDFHHSALCWSFFLFYISEPIMELMYSALDQSIVPWQAQEILKLALQGRNLLCHIARESQMNLALQLARDICHCAAIEVLQRCDVQADLCRAVQDPNIEDIDAEGIADEWRRLMERRRMKRNGQVDSPAFPNKGSAPVREDSSNGEMPYNNRDYVPISQLLSDERSTHPPSHHDQQYQPLDFGGLDQSEWLEALFAFEMPSNLQSLQLVPNTTSDIPTFNNIEPIPDTRPANISSRPGTYRTYLDRFMN